MYFLRARLVKFQHICKRFFKRCCCEMWSIWSLSWTSLNVSLQPYFNVGRTLHNRFLCRRLAVGSLSSVLFSIIAQRFWWGGGRRAGGSVAWRYLKQLQERLETTNLVDSILVNTWTLGQVVWVRAQCVKLLENRLPLTASLFTQE